MSLSFGQVYPCLRREPGISFNCRVIQSGVSVDSGSFRQVVILSGMSFHQGCHSVRDFIPSGMSVSSEYLLVRALCLVGGGWGGDVCNYFRRK